MIRLVRAILANCLGMALLIVPPGLLGATAGQQVPPDNTQANQRDRKGSEPTPGQQKENATDRELTQKIRRSITQDKSLSTYARNIKIISQNGNVTLRGPVRSEEERKTIETKADDIAGSTHVKNELQVAPSKPTSKSRPDKGQQ
jgi:hyperosmotically inducible protein